MASSESFTFVESTKDLTKEGFHDYVDILSARVADVDIQFSSRLRSEYPEMIVTTVPGSNIDLIFFANLGHASYELEIKNDSISRWRGYVPPDPRGGQGFLGEIINYARYNYKFGEEYFIMYYVKFGFSVLQYVLKEPRGTGENPNTHSSFTDKLLKAAGDLLYKQSPGIFVFDNYWYKDKELYEQVQKSTWDKVILDPDMKKDLTQVSERFFDSKEIYDDLGVPWKRGIMFHG
jgi:transitional endoplasmic reticulum ATPase